MNPALESLLIWWLSFARDYLFVYCSLYVVMATFFYIQSNEELSKVIGSTIWILPMTFIIYNTDLTRIVFDSASPELLAPVISSFEFMQMVFPIIMLVPIIMAIWKSING